MLAQWFRKTYFLDGRLINLVPGSKEEYYNPFDFYREGNRNIDNLHHVFASINTTDSDKIVAFFNSYGPLGIIGRDIMKITRPYKLNGKQTGLLVVRHDSDELIPIMEFLEDYDIPVSTFGSKLINAHQIPSLLEVSMFSGESIDRFAFHHERFCWTLDMLTALFLKDEESISKLLNDSRPAITELIASTSVHQGEYTSTAEKHAVAMGIIVTHINMELANRTSVKVSVDNAFRSISKEQEWSFDSLLTALYLMVMMDIKRGVISRSCEACGRYFETNRSDIQYCSSKCQSRINTRKHLHSKQQVIDMAFAGDTVEEIAIKTGREITQIESWIQQRKE